MVFGRDRVSPRFYFFACCMVSLGTMFLSFWILANNSWMQVSLGYAIDPVSPGRRDLLWVAQLQSEQIATQAALIKLKSLQGANRIRLQLALGGSFDSSPAATFPNVATNQPPI